MDLKILANVLKFLERVTVTGSEAYAWTEAHQFIQNEMNRSVQVQMEAAVKANSNE